MGISDDWSFEEDVLSQNPLVQLVGLDGTVSAGRFGVGALSKLTLALKSLLQGRISQFERALLEAKWSAITAIKFLRFFARGNREFIQKMVRAEASPDGITWKEALARLHSVGNSTKSILVKMDIEGGEYAILPELLKESDEVSLLIVEFHDCGARWTDFQAIIAEICRCFTVVHVHGNNYIPLIPSTNVPEVLEISFLRSSLLTKSDELATQPVKYPLTELDQPNDPARPDYSLAF
ncbi:FkbM family methyltransferase [Gemmatimonas groenlandica]|nr:FkbM family methyltransferase [Gemmatimonas groenlandica]